MSYVNEQPGATAPPSTDRFGSVKRYGKKFTTRDGWLGDYDFGELVLLFLFRHESNV